MTGGGKAIRGAVGDVRPSPFAPLKALLQPHEQDAAEGIRRLAAALQGLGAAARLHLRVLDGETVEHWEVEGGTLPAAARQQTPKNADMTLILRRDTWLRMAHGRLSPFDALLSGRMRLGGDTALAKSIVKHLSDPTVPFVGLC
jgi:alkyl sulfatase BDS1-like metallo-beta-lactamase superfamily hydrolase